MWICDEVLNCVGIVLVIVLIILFFFMRRFFFCRFCIILMMRSGMFVVCWRVFISFGLGLLLVRFVVMV